MVENGEWNDSGSRNRGEGRMGEVTGEKVGGKNDVPGETERKVWWGLLEVIILFLYWCGWRGAKFIFLCHVCSFHFLIHLFNEILLRVSTSQQMIHFHQCGIIFSCSVWLFHHFHKQPVSSNILYRIEGSVHTNNWHPLKEPREVVSRTLCSELVNVVIF